MSSITEQFSAVTKSQLETQFQIFNSLAHTAVDSAEKLIALNINATKASVEKSSAAAKKLLEIKDAKELFSASRETTTGIDSLLAYSRELFAIASGVQAELIKSTRGTALPQLAAPWAAPVAEVAEVAKTSASAAAASVAEAVKAATPAVAPVAETVKAASPAVAPVAEAVKAAPRAVAAAAPSPAPATPVAAAAAAVAPVAVPAAAPELAPELAPTTAPATEKAPPATTIQAAVSAAVHADDAPALADTPAQLAPQPLAASVSPTAPEAIKPTLKPATDTAPPAAAKPAFPDAKPIALAADTKTSRLKTITPKAKNVDAPASKHKK